MSAEEDDTLRADVVSGLRSARERGREEGRERPELPPYDSPMPSSAGLAPLGPGPSEAPVASPDREELNTAWNVASALTAPPASRWGRLFAPLRGPLRRLVRFALGPVVEQQERFNSAQVRFDNALVHYLDDRLDRLSAHYDRILGQHGKRMEEIDERHLILQQELIRHVHDLVERIEFVFENAEQNHLYLEGMLRETKEELQALAARLDAGPKQTR